MTEDQYQQLRQFIKLNGRYLKKISPQQLINLKQVSNDAKNIRNRIFSHKSLVIKASRYYEKVSNINTLAYLNERIKSLHEIKTEFSKFFFETPLSTIKSDREKHEQ